ncbi:hypothetical protein IVA96_08000 [Bradyrhizobium sp. 159]|uniref:hypothetical protein n=1 Tax=Bradyrhizobium sp. 159 TaxID=2782632 RepID=UPI001FF75CC8|nr:hypothetical protein [Bradyrhizobium sp. 159]MCK1616591.1 hypothetical protein [Bradyrhizobium sp. 159]
MSERGVFAVDRGVFDHPKFSHDEPLSRLEAWLWLLSRAAWRPIKHRISGRVIELRRGQLTASTRYMAEQWRWKEPRVRRFLYLLKTDPNNDAEIDTQTDAGITVITIRKYDQYQRVSLPANVLGDSGINAGVTHDRRKEEDIKDIEGSEAKASDVGASVYTDAKHHLWAEGVPILVSLGENEGRSRQMIGMWLKQTSDDARRVLSAIQRARDHRVHGPIAWITRALNSGHDNGQRNRNGRTDRTSGHATAREASFVASLGKGAFGQLEKGGAAGPIRPLSDDAGAACASNAHPRPASRH